MKPLTEEQKIRRQDDLAARALEILGSTGYPKLTIEAVAKAAGLAKGTVFLAFASKEDLVLHGVRRRFDRWIGRLETLDPAGLTPKALAEKILETLEADPEFLPLTALVGPVLEQGCTGEAVLAFKRALAAGMANLEQAWSLKIPGKSPGSLGPFFMGVYALIVGAWSVGEASASVREALEGQPDLAVFQTRFKDLFLPLLENQIESLLTPRSPRKNP